MKNVLTLKNVKYSDFASQETHCFHATVYKDGKRWCFAENDGHGGATMLYALNDGKPSKLREEIAAINAELPEAVGLAGTPREFTYRQTVESVVDELVTEWLYVQDVKKLLKKPAAVNAKGQIVQWAGKPTPQFLAALALKNPDYVILNVVPFDEAVRIYREKVEGTHG